MAFVMYLLRSLDVTSLDAMSDTDKAYLYI